MNNSLTRNTGDIETARYIDEYFRGELIVKRNKRMSQRVLQLLNTNPEQSFFFAFGAGKTYLFKEIIKSFDSLIKYKFRSFFRKQFNIRFYARKWI